MARKSKQDYARLLDKLFEENMLWFVLGSLISAEAYMCEAEEGIKRRKQAITQLQGFVDCVERTKLPDDKKESVRKFAADGVLLLTDEINELSNTLTA